MVANQVLKIEVPERAKPSLFIRRVTSSHIFNLKSPQILQDYVDRESFLRSNPLFVSLLSKGMPLKSVISLYSCGMDTGSPNSILCSCGCGRRLSRIVHHCSHRSCPKCAKRRERRLFRKYYPLIRNLVSTSTHSLKFFTISPKNYKSLKEGHEDIRKQISRLLRAKYFKDRISSGIYVIESKSLNKEGLSKGWNVHAHMLVYSKFLNNRLYGFCFDCNRRMWLKYDHKSKHFYCSKRACNSLNVKHDGKNSELHDQLSHYFPSGVVSDIKTLKSHFNKSGYFRSTKHSLNYCLKYVGVNKDDFASLDDAATYISYTANRRLISVFGRFYDFKTDKYPYICIKCKEVVIFELVNNFDYPDDLKPPIKKKKEGFSPL